MKKYIMSFLCVSNCFSALYSMQEGKKIEDMGASCSEYASMARIISPAIDNFQKVIASEVFPEQHAQDRYSIAYYLRDMKRKKPNFHDKSLNTSQEMKNILWMDRHIKMYCDNILKLAHTLRIIEDPKWKFYLLEYDKEIAFTLFHHIIHDTQTNWFSEIDISADYKTDGVDDDGNTLLHYAVYNKDTQAAIYFIKSGVNFFARNKDEKTSINILYDTDDQEFISYILGVILTHVLQKNPKEVSKQHKEIFNYVYLDVCDDKGFPFLLRALMLYPDWAKELIEHVADVNVCDKRTGVSPLKYALLLSNQSLVQLLLARGARVEERMKKLPLSQNLKDLLHTALEKQENLYVE